MITREFPAVLYRSGLAVVRLPIQCTLTYDSSTDPLAVKLGIKVPEVGESVEWTVGRDYLNEGRLSTESYGQGDIRIRWYPAGNVLGLCLRNPDGHADINLPYHEVAQFMTETMVEVPIGDENAEALIDHAVAKILDQG